MARVWHGNAGFRRMLVPIDSLAPHPSNPRRHDLATIKASLEAFGQQRPILVVPAGRVDVDQPTIIAGHGTTAAARELGWTHVARLVSDLSDAEIERYVLADNRSSDLGGYDDEQLARLLAEVEERGGLEGTGWRREDLNELLADLAVRDRKSFQTAPDAAPDLPVESKSKVGELYELGPHRLMCADATREEDVRELFSPPHHHALDQVSTIWTDPPYGVDYTGKTRDALKLENDQAEGLRALLAASFQAVAPALEPHARFYVAGPAGPRATDFLSAFDDAGWRLHQILAWVKQRLILGHSDYHYQHEFVFYGWASSSGKGRPGRGAHRGTRWYGGNDQSSVFFVDAPSRSTEHPTMKPVELVQRQLANSTQRGAIVYDPFAGSGTTMIACEILGHRCRAMEIDPRYCDVARQRYADFTGQSELAP